METIKSLQQKNLGIDNSPDALKYIGGYDRLIIKLYEKLKILTVSSENMQSQIIILNARLDILENK